MGIGKKHQILSRQILNDNKLFSPAMDFFEK